jgi:ABC-type branched-subunit amino acid transport system substrate-binding protein
VESDAGTAFEAAWQAAYGELPAYPYLREVYDAIYLISLAAEKADSTDSAAIRDALRDVASEPGTVVSPGTDGWKAAVEDLTAGDDVNYEGASGPVDFDAAGDVSKGAILIWQVSGEAIQDAETRTADLSVAAGATPAAATPVS